MKFSLSKIFSQPGNEGFSLIELLVVISIIGTLATLLITNLVGVRGRADDARLKSDLRQLKTALRLYYNDFNRYPITAVVDGKNAMFGCGDSGQSACTPGETFSAGADDTVYMQELPSDFSYTVSADGESFVLGATLSNLSDPDLQTSAETCGQVYSSVSGSYFVCSD